MKKLISVALISFVLLTSLIFPLSASAASVLYSNLPEPVATQDIKYFVLQSESGASARIFVFMFPGYGDNINFDVVWTWNTTNSRWQYYVSATNMLTGANQTNYSYTMSYYTFVDGNYQSSYQRETGTSYTLSSTYTITSFPNYACYGCSIVNPSGASAPLSGLNLANLAWGEKSNHDLLTTLAALNLSNIESSLSNIYGAVDQIEGYINSLESYTDGIEGYIDQLEGYLDQVEGYLNTTNTLLTQFKSLFQTEIDDVETKLDNIYLTANNIYSRCGTIITKLDTLIQYAASINTTLGLCEDHLARIYKLLGGGEVVPTYPDESQLNGQVDDYVSEENSHMNNFDNDIGDFEDIIDELPSAIEEDISGSNDNLAAGFLAFNSLFQSFVLDFPLVSLLILFVLTFGLFILILGKKVN